MSGDKFVAYAEDKGYTIRVNPTNAVKGDLLIGKDNLGKIVYAKVVKVLPIRYGDFEGQMEYLLISFNKEKRVWQKFRQITELFTSIYFFKKPRS